MVTGLSNLDKFLEYLKKQEVLGNLCERCNYRLKQKDGNIYCFDCMCDLEIQDNNDRRREYY